MNPTILTIALKELRETLRDKRTLIAMIGVPVVLYPLLMLLALQFVTVQQATLEREVSRIAFAGEPGGELRGWIESMPKIEIVEADDLDEALTTGELDAVVAPPVDPAAGAADATGTAEIVIRFDGTKMPSRKARDRLTEALKEHAEQRLHERLAIRELDRSFVQPIKVTADDAAPPTKHIGSALGSILPMLMIVMLGVGAFYPAIDLTAGEKERGTFETLLSTPVSKLQIVVGKFVTVFALSLTTGLLNLASMAATVGFQLAQLSDGMPEGRSLFNLEDVRFTIGDGVIIVLVLVPLAVLISAMMMAVAVFARDFKEAQNYVTPFFIAIIMPAMFAMMPGVELTAGTALIPIANVSLLFKQMLVGETQLHLAFLVLMCTAAYAALALVAANWLFQHEEIMLGDDRRAGLSWRRSNMRPRQTPTIGMAVGLYVIALLALFYVGAYVQQQDVIVGLLITQWGLILGPVLLLVWYAKLDWRDSLNLHAPRWPTWGGALLMALGGMVVVLQLSIWQERVLPIPEEFARAMEQLIGADRPLWLLLLAIAVSPAICEELLFRGAILSGMRTQLGRVAAVIIVAVLFGLLHMSVYRLMGTTVLGLSITYVAVRTGSIYPGMLMHLVNNALAVLLQREALPSWIIEPLKRPEFEQTGFTWPVLGGAAAVVIAGIVVIEIAGRTARANRNGGSAERRGDEAPAEPR